MIGRTHDSNVEQGVTGETVRVGIEDLREVKLDMSGREANPVTAEEDDEADGEEDESQAASPVR